MGLTSMKHFFFICSLTNGCKFISGFTSGHAAGSLGKLSMINLLSQYSTETFNVKPVVLLIIIVDVLIVKSSLLLFLGVIKKKKWLLCQWIWVIIIGKAIADSSELYLGANKLLQGYTNEGVTDIVLSVIDAMLYAYFALVVGCLINQIASEEKEKPPAHEKQ